VKLAASLIATFAYWRSNLNCCLASCKIWVFIVSVKGDTSSGTSAATAVDTWWVRSLQYSSPTLSASLSKSADFLSKSVEKCESTTLKYRESVYAEGKVLSTCCQCYIFILCRNSRCRATIYLRGGEPYIYYHEPHELCITAGRPKNQWTAGSSPLIYLMGSRPKAFQKED